MDPATACSEGVWNRGEVSQHFAAPRGAAGVWLSLPVLSMGINQHLWLALTSGGTWLFFILRPHQRQTIPETFWAPSLSAGSSCAISIGTQGGIYAKPGSSASRFSPWEEHSETQWWQHNLTVIRVITIYHYGTSQSLQGHLKSPFNGRFLVP